MSSSAFTSPSTTGRTPRSRSRLRGALAVAPVLVALGAAPSSAEFRSGILTCGATACSDVFKVDCAGTQIMDARVLDPAGSDDTVMVTYVALVPSSIKGQAEVEIADVPGSFSGRSVLVAKRDTTMSALAVVSTASASSAEYQIEFTCLKGNGGLVTPKKITLLQNQ